MKIINCTESENDKNIINRDNELKEFKKLLYSAQNSQVYIVYSQTAYGKSFFSAKLSRIDFFSDWDIIRIKTAPKNNEPNVPEGEYLGLIFKAFNAYFKAENSENFKFKNYIISGRNKFIEKLAINELIDKLSSSDSFYKIGNNFLFILLKRLFRIGDFDSYKVERDNSMLSRNIQADYIHHVFEHRQVLLIIENIQNIDNMSYKFLVDWINDTKDKKHVFILECTISERYTQNDLNVLQRSISQTKAEIYKFDLPQMPPEFIPDIVDAKVVEHSSDIRFTTNVVKHYNEYSHGNLYDLIDYVRTYNDNNTTQSKELPEPTLSILKILSSESQYIVSILFFHAGSIDKSLFEYIWSNYFFNNSNKFSDELYSELISAGTIKIQRDETVDKIVISHASILDVWASGGSDFATVDRDTLRRLENFYKEKYNKENDNQNKKISWQMLMRIYAINSPSKIMELLDDFKLNIMKTISRENTWSYLELLIKNTQNQIPELEDVYFKILQICCSASLYKEGYDCIQLMEKQLNIEKNDNLLLNKLMFISILDDHNLVIKLYKNALKRIEIYSSTWIKLKLMVLCSYNALGNSSECWKINKELLQVPDFKHKNEYPIYLRLTNIYKTPSKAIGNAKKSIKIFHHRNDYKQEGKSLITYSKLLSSLGKHKKAIKMILRAKKILENLNEGMSCIYNNLAGYLLLSGESGAEIWNYLDIAEVYSVSTYDKLSVVLNKLAWCYENNSFMRLDLLESRALELIKLEPSKFIHCTTYYNLYVVMKKAGMKDKANKYYLRAIKLQDKCSCIKARIAGVTRKTRYLKPRIEKPYHICYLSFWVFDL